MQQPVAGDRSTAVPSQHSLEASLSAGSYCAHRLIEDPEWSLATVPCLTELCLQHIVHNFESKWERVSSGTHRERASVLGSRGSTRQADASEGNSAVPNPAKGTDGKKYPLGQLVKQTV